MVEIIAKLQANCKILPSVGLTNGFHSVSHSAMRKYFFSSTKYVRCNLPRFKPENQRFSSKVMTTYYYATQRHDNVMQTSLRLVTFTAELRPKSDQGNK